MICLSAYALPWWKHCNRIACSANKQIFHPTASPELIRPSVPTMSNSLLIVGITRYNSIIIYGIMNRIFMLLYSCHVVILHRTPIIAPHWGQSMKQCIAPKSSQGSPAFFYQTARGPVKQISSYGSEWPYASGSIHRLSFPWRLVIPDHYLPRLLGQRRAEWTCFRPKK